MQPITVSSASTRALLILLCLLLSANASAQTIAITHVTVIDTNGGPSQRDVTVVIRDSRIATIGNVAAPKNATVVNGRGKFLIPGLWDMHVHLSWTTSSALPLLVANGVTSVRDMGSALGEIDDWRSRIAAGVLTGPRIFRVGPILNGQKFNPYQLLVGNPDQARGVVRALKDVGVDFIKIHRRVPRDSYFALMDEAKKQGIAVVGHIPMTVSPDEAADTGQATIEHTDTLFEGTFSAALPKDAKLSEAVRRWRTTEAADNLFGRFVKNHTVVTLTLVPYRSIIDAADPARPPDPNARYVAASVKKAFAQHPLTMSPAELAETKATFVEFIEVVRQMHRDGVTLVAGTDIAGPRIPGFTLHDELALLVDAGLTPLEALQAATLTPARVVGKWNELGTIQPGKLADLVLLDADPLADIHHTQRIAAVVVNGKLLRRADLDALLREAERLASRN